MNVTYGARTDESRAFHIAVYETVQCIPFGHVTSYGHVAKLIGTPEKSRQVGFALKHLPRFNDENSPEFNVVSVPWQRVINSSGSVSMPRTRYHQIEKLREEIPVNDDGAVDISRYGWFPDPDTFDLDSAHR